MSKETESLKQAGIKAAIDNADHNIPGWSEMAYHYLKKFIRYYPGKNFRAEEVRNWAYGKGLVVPPNHRAWGSVIARAKKDGIIRFTGYGQVSNPKAHKTPASVWQKAVV